MEKIKDIRASVGMTQAAFAAALEIPVRTLQDWEHGRRQAPDYLIKLIEYRVTHDRKFRKPRKPDKLEQLRQSGADKTSLEEMSVID